MKKEFIYDCASAPRRDPNQCYNDIHALMFLTVLCEMEMFYEDDDEEPNIIKEFFLKEVGFAVESQYAEQMQDDLITIKSKWSLVSRSSLALDMMAFTLELLDKPRKFNEFNEYYASRKNQVYLCVEKLLQGLATAELQKSAETKSGKKIVFHFDEKLAREQLKEFRELIHIERFI